MEQKYPFFSFQTLSNLFLDLFSTVLEALQFSNKLLKSLETSSNPT